MPAAASTDHVSILCNAIARSHASQCLLSLHSLGQAAHCLLVQVVFYLHGDSNLHAFCPALFH